MIARKASKHYDLVVLSDHGQTPCVSFKHLYKDNLRRSIEKHLNVPLSEPSGHTLELAYFNTLLEEMRRVEEAYGTRPIRSGRRTLERLQHRMREEPAEAKDEGIVVCANGPLAHVYFMEQPGRVTMEYLLERHPTLLEYLVSHPGIGFVIATNTEGEHVMMGKKGMRRLRAGVVDGSDPAGPFADGSDINVVVNALTRLSQYPHSGDLIINGSLLPNRGVVTFEEQRGTHGGLGGGQTEAFVVFPRRFRAGVPPVHGPAQMHEFLSSLMAR